MKATELKAGQKIKFTPTGHEFTLAKVTEKRISWYVGFSYKGGSGKNILRMASTSVNIFQQGIDSGAYIIL